MIAVENLTKYYGDAAAISDLSFSVAEGEIMGFLGPNGAGKTTTMRILTGYLPASSGRAVVAGFDLFTHSLEARRRLGYLPENVPLYSEMRVREYLRYRARLKGVRRCDLAACLRDVIDRCWLGEVYHRIIGQLSKGYRQRVGLAEALLADPRVLILDEPTVGLDPHQISKIRALIKELGKNRTVLLSTHILPEVEMICNRTLIINYGKIVAAGTLPELRARQRERVVVEAEGVPAEKLVREISVVKGVRQAVPLPERAGAVAVEADPGAEIRPLLFDLAKGSGWRLLELKRESRSLEEVFISITQGSESSETAVVAVDRREGEGEPS